MNNPKVKSFDGFSFGLIEKDINNFATQNEIISISITSCFAYGREQFYAMVVYKDLEGKVNE